MTDSPERDSLNQWNDRVIETTGTHGADIASQRMDELDEAALRFALDWNDEPVTALDLGCGMGVQGLRFSLTGVDTTLVDILDISERVEALNELFDIGDLRFLERDVRELTAADVPANLKLVYSQRFVHYLTWDETHELFELLAENVQPGGRLFVSASGLNTELGEGYPDRDAPPERRFSELAPAVAEKHDIREKVCLYEREDMRRLLTETGFRVKSISTSGFGNVKAIAERG